MGGGKSRLELIKLHLKSQKPPICKSCEYPNMASTVSLNEHLETIKKIFGETNEK